MSEFGEMCAEMERIHGSRGWKRRLAEMLEVSDSNVQNWIRAGDAPAIVKTAFAAKMEIRELEQELASRDLEKVYIQSLGDDRGFRVLVRDEESGLLHEYATAREKETARAIAHFVSGSLQQKIATVYDSASILLEGHPDDLRALEDLWNWNRPTRREFEANVTGLGDKLFQNIENGGSGDDE